MSEPAIVFDYGGVLTGPPFDEVNRYGDEVGLPPHTLESFFIDDPVFSDVERGKVSMADFLRSMRDRCRERHDVVIDLHEVGAALKRARLIRPEMIDLVVMLAESHRLAMLTNNVRENEDWLPDALPAGVFETIVNSAVVGRRKPDPAIYQYVLAQLGIEGSEAIYIDDFAVNLPPARDLGMRTILFASPMDCRAALRAFGAAC